MQLDKAKKVIICFTIVVAKIFINALSVLCDNNLEEKETERNNHMILIYVLTQTSHSGAYIPTWDPCFRSLFYDPSVLLFHSSHV